jgi:sugar transferase (PEP-CTERM/EpsH1 system associated)
MNILFLAPRLPLPADTGGKIRTLNILKQLAKGNRVYLLCFTFEEADQLHAQSLQQLGIEVDMVSMSDPSMIQKITAVTFNSRPFSISKYDTSPMRQRLKEVLANRAFDAVHVDHLHMAVYQDCLKNIPCFLDEHNVEYKILERCGNVEKSGIKKLLYQNQSHKMKVFETQKVKEFKGIFACSSEDQMLLNDLAKVPVPTHVIPNGVDTDYFNANLQHKEHEDALVFTGSMDWLPNDDAITYFCKEILPLVWGMNNMLKLYVVGKNPSKLVKELAERDHHVIVTGRVDDVRPFVEKSKIFIVPLRIGGGTRLKILEAMAMGKAIVSTTIGAEGIECKDGVNIAIADTPHDFAKKIIDLCSQPVQVTSMGQEGRSLVCQKYDWAIVGRKLNAIYQEVIHANN